MAVGEGLFAEGKKGKGGKISNWNKEKREEHMARRFQGEGGSVRGSNNEITNCGRRIIVVVHFLFANCFGRKVFKTK